MNQAQKILAKVFRIPISEKAASGTYQVLNGNIIHSADNKINYLTKGYDINDTIYSIVNLITEKVKVAPWGVYKIQDEQKLKQYHGILRSKDAGDYKKAMKLKGEALVPYEDLKLNDLIDSPNDYCTFNDIVADSSTYKLLTGDRMIHATLLGMGANTGKPQQLHILPSQHMIIVVSRTFPMEALAYELPGWGIPKIPKAEVLHDKYFNTTYDNNGSHLYGLAPMKAALRLTDRSNSANTAATAAFYNGGPKSIVFMDDQRFSPEQGLAQVNAIKEKLQGKEYTGANNFNKTASSGYKMGVVPVGLSPVELGIIESEKWDLRRFCNVFGGVPSQLLNDPENKTYSNTVEGERALTARCALPQLNSFRDSFNKKLKTDWGYKGQNIYIDYDISVYSELQEDLGKKWGWVKELPVPNGYKLDLMGMDHPEGHEDFMEKILVPSGYTTSEDYEQNQTDRDLEAGDEEVPGD